VSTNDLGAFEFLKRLTETPGVPGREERVRDLILAETAGLWDETAVDAMGNLICIKRAARKPPKGQARAPRVMLACHMDEIGFYVRYIDESGFVRIHNVGGFDTRNLFARRVVVHGRRDLVGVLNPVGKPIHLASEEDKKKIPQINEFCIDLFLPKGDVFRLVEIGDPVTLAQTTEFIGDAICGKAMDNRVASWVGINAIRQAYGLADHGKGPKDGKKKAKAAGSAYDIYFVACTQEEVGLRGATTAAYGIDPDVGIAIDTTLCCDTPGVGKDEAVTELGKGVGIKLLDGAAISHRGLFDEFVAIAKREKIPFQRELLPRGGTDAGAVQRARAGIKTITLSVPTRYIHTVTETIDRKDAQAAVDLLAAWLRA
jgi:tetrahedral aminopeptidase